MPDEKELTIEEMKSLVSLSTLLPALLDKISAISKDISDLKSSFTDIKIKFNTNATAVGEYKASVDELIQKQPDFSALQKEIEDIKNSLGIIKTDLNMKTEIAQAKPTPAATPKKEKSKKEKDKDGDKVEEIVDRILAMHGGRKIRLLTLIDIKNGFKVDEEMAAKVIKWFEDRKMYNSKTRTLTFPKR